MTHGDKVFVLEAPPCGTFCVDFDLHLEVDSDRVGLDIADPLALDKLSQKRMACVLDMTFELDSDNDIDDAYPSDKRERL